MKRRDGRPPHMGVPKFIILFATLLLFAVLVVVLNVELGRPWW